MMTYHKERVVKKTTQVEMKAEGDQEENWGVWVVVNGDNSIPGWWTIHKGRAPTKYKSLGEYNLT